jgi:predicted outer membrane repeat protein
MLDSASENLGSAGEVFLIDGAAIRREITLGGYPGAGMRGDGAAGKAVLRVKNGGQVAIRNISLTGGEDAGLVLEGSSGARMESGRIADSGRGVSITGGSSFLMEGGAIENNTAAASGGGVYVRGQNSSFTMRGDSRVSGNTAVTGSALLAEDHAAILMEGTARVFGNTATGLGLPVEEISGCVLVNDYSSLTMDANAAVTNNIAGAGVFLKEAGFLVMKGEAEISGTIGGNGVGVMQFCELKMSGKARIIRNDLNGIYHKNFPSTTGKFAFVSMNDEAEVSYNGKTGVYSSFEANFIMTDRSCISYNANSGILMLTADITISGSARIENNTSPENGGGLNAEGS